MRGLFDPKLTLVRYGVNGAVATGVHYGVLLALLNGLDLASAGLANFLAALVGITASFLGSRYFVFPGSPVGLGAQIARFGLLYLALAGLHGGFLLVWSDRLHLPVETGFLIALALQVVASYFGNKYLVFAATGRGPGAGG